MRKRRVPRAIKGPGPKLTLKERTDKMMGSLIKSLNANALKDNPEINENKDNNE